MNEPQSTPVAPAPDEAPARSPLRWSIMGAALLFLIDIILFMPGIGLVLSLLRALIAGASAMAKLMFRPATARLPGKIMLIYLCCLAAIVIGMRMQEQIGMRNAEPVIAALQQYHHETGEWPDNLQALVPRYLESLPLSAYRMTGNQYHFSNGEYGAYLYYYPAPPTIYNEYSLATGTWHRSAND